MAEKELNAIKPNHYQDCSMQCFENMEIIFGKDNIAMFYLENAYKYLWRYKFKNGQEDLRKCKEYLNMFQRLHGKYELNEVLLLRFEPVALEMQELCDKYLEKFKSCRL